MDLSGETFGALTVLERIDDYVSPGGKTHPQYRCRCVCGSDTLALGHNLKSWRKQTCGDREKHPIIATGPKTQRMPNSYYAAVREWAKTGDDTRYREFIERWTLYQLGRGPKP